jgi:hypothetical protein
LPHKSKRCSGGLPRRRYTVSILPEPELSDEALEVIRWQEENPDVWGDQDKNGVDLARLRENLKLTRAERLSQL